jgi:hypothetical protein
MGATGATPVGVAASAPGTYDVLGAYAQAVASAPCSVDARDLAAIQSVESPSAVVDETGMVSNPDGSPVRGDGGQSYGAFQFYTEAGTWTVYGDGGNPDRLPDAAAATARMLCANNYATDRHAAIARHNGSGPAAQAYADRVIAAADGAPPIAAGQSSSTSDCQPGSGRSIGVVFGRAWCNLVVRPWLALGSRNPDNDAWDKVDHAVFGDATSSAPATVAPSSLPNGDGLQPDFAKRLGQMFAAAPGSVTITSGFRTTAEQLSLGGGDPDCGVMVACVRDGVCGSQHCKGLAADLGFENDATKAWVHAHVADYGLTFPMSYEPWHVEPIGARS